jgi:hypothetical protein
MMSRLSVKKFLTFSGDQELDQYRLLSGIKEYSVSFRKKMLYPALSDLIDFAMSLDSLLKDKKSMLDSFPKHLTGFDLEKKKILVEDIEKLDQNLESIFELIEWALPIIRETIDEGVALYEFVEKNIRIDEVGILPLYRDEGYFIIPDNNEDKLLIHSFHFALFEQNKEKYRSLKTKLIDAVEKALENTPEHIKLKMLSRYKHMPNPATYFCGTDLDLPFYETLFPVAKRKLLSKIS